MAVGFSAERSGGHGTRGHGRLRAVGIHSEHIVEAQGHRVLRKKALVSFENVSNVLVFAAVTVLERLALAGCTSGKDSRESHTPEDTSNQLDVRLGVASKLGAICACWSWTPCLLAACPNFPLESPKTLPVGLSAVGFQNTLKTFEDVWLIEAPEMTDVDRDSRT